MTKGIGANGSNHLRHQQRNKTKKLEMTSLDSFIQNLIGVSTSVMNADILLTMFVAVVTAFFGAYAGGRAAQNVSERNKLLNEVVQELRAINASISLAFIVCNTFLNLKEQHVLSLKSRFDTGKLNAQKNFEAQRSGGMSTQPFSFVAEFVTLNPTDVPINELQRLVFEKTSVTGKPLTLMTTLSQVICSLNRITIERNHFIQKEKEKPQVETKISPFQYYGIPDRDGTLDNTYSDYMSAISAHTDDCIMFSNLLIRELNKEGEKISSKYAKKFKNHLPSIHKIDFSEPKSKGLFPSEDDYIDWLNS
jgi:hypothetical protein